MENLKLHTYKQAYIMLRLWQDENPLETSIASTLSELVVQSGDLLDTETRTHVTREVNSCFGASAPTVETKAHCVLCEEESTSLDERDECSECADEARACERCETRTLSWRYVYGQVWCEGCD